MSTPIPHFTEPTTLYWQTTFSPSDTISETNTTPRKSYQYSYPALLPNNHILHLPIRQLPTTPSEGVASLILNQASFSVVQQLCSSLAKLIKPYNVDVVIGLPTLGLAAAAIVAQELGHDRYVPLGYSHKFWYLTHLSTTTSSITSPSAQKPLFLDPNQLPLIVGKRCALIDDAVSSGKTLSSAWDFLESENVGAKIEVVGVCMKQGERWREFLDGGENGGEADDKKKRSDKVEWVFESPLLKAVDDGWVIRD